MAAGARLLAMSSTSAARLLRHRPSCSRGRCAAWSSGATANSARGLGGRSRDGAAATPSATLGAARARSVGAGVHPDGTVTGLEGIVGAGVSPPRVAEVRAAPGVAPDPPRLDAYLTANVPDVSRGRIVSSIKDGLVHVNGKLVKKPSYKVASGDAIVCVIPAPPPVEAAPEDIPLEVTYEDEHLMVVNKPAGMVVHPSAGHERGTLVNAVLYHCRLPAMRVVTGSHNDKREESGGGGGEEDEADEDEGDSWTLAGQGGSSNSGSNDQPIILRPGIVHRLDKGTSGLIVVAKDGPTHTGLCEQFAVREGRKCAGAGRRPRGGLGRGRGGGSALARLHEDNTAVVYRSVHSRQFTHPRVRRRRRRVGCGVSVG